jgi:hypothetical protein
MSICNPFYFSNPNLGSSQSGKGILDTVKSALSGETATSIKNAFQDNRQYPGENHVPQYDTLDKKDSKLKLASYMGPGTKLINRLEKNVKPISLADKTAQAHDIRYAEASLIKGDPKKRQEAIREADMKMINKLTQLKSKKLDKDFNINMGLLPMRAKVMAEDVGVLSHNAFAPPPRDSIPPKDSARIKKKLLELEQQGFGTPAYNLKKETLKNLDKLLPKEGRGVVLAGSKKGKGIMLAGQKGKGLEDFVDGFKYGWNQIKPRGVSAGGPETYDDLMERKKNRMIRDKMEKDISAKASMDVLKALASKQGKILRVQGDVGDEARRSLEKSKGLAPHSLDPKTLKQMEEDYQKFKEQKGLGYDKKYHYDKKLLKNTDKAVKKAKKNVKESEEAMRDRMAKVRAAKKEKAPKAPVKAVKAVKKE